MREKQLAAAPLFADLPAGVLRKLAERAVPRRYPPGSVIFVQGDAGDRCYVIVSGAVKIAAYAPDGREAVLAVLGPGDLFGELALFDSAPRSADAIVIDDAELLSLDGEAITGAARSNPEMALAWLRILAKRLRMTNEALQDAAFFDVAGRVARRLADLAEAHGEVRDDGVAIKIPVSQESLANMVGATRESVNKALGALARRNLVVREGRRYVVRDIDQLRARAR